MEQQDNLYLPPDLERCSFSIAATYALWYQFVCLVVSHSE